jgi:hypothetical protein
MDKINDNFALLDNVFNVLSYANGEDIRNGVVDATAAFQGAINAALLAGGGVVDIPDGLYNFAELSDSIDPDAGNIVFRGASKQNTILFWDEGDNITPKYLFFNNDDNGGVFKGVISFRH